MAAARHPVGEHMITGKYNLSLQTAETFTQQFKILAGNGVSFDLSDYTASSFIKADFADTTASAVFTCSITSPIEGLLDISLHASSSAVLTDSCYFYDIRLLKNDGVVLYPLEGKVVVSNSITKEI